MDQQKSQAQEDRLWALLDAGLSLTGELDLDAVLGRIVDAARTLIGAKYAALGVIDENRRALSNFVYRGITEAQREAIGRLPIGRGLLGALIDDPRPIRLTEIKADVRSVGFPENHPPMNSFLGVPVVSKGQVFGNLYLTEKEGGGEFTPEDERLAIALASQAGVAVENARLYGLVTQNEAASRRRLRELEVVQEIGAALLSELDPTRVLRLIAHEALELMGGTAAFVVMSDDDDALRVRVAAGRGAAVIEGTEISKSGSLIGYAMQVLEPILVEDVTTDPRRAVITEQLKGRATIVAPLIERRTAVGALGVVHGEPGYFKTEDLFVARRFADLGSLALRNAHFISRERDHARMEAELAESQLKEQLRADTLHAVIRAQEDERARIARELHDSAGQAMASILLSLKMALNEESPDKIKERLADLRDVAATTAADIRRISHELRPALLDDLGLKAGLERYCSDVSMRAGIPVEASVRLGDERLESEVETVLYRIVQEAITNALKSASASRIDISLDDLTGDLRLVIADDGSGFDPDNVTRGLGLLGMRERAELINGKLEIRSAIGRGTSIELEVPRP